MAVETVENTTQATGGKSRRKRSKAIARKAASRRRITNANLRASAEQVLREGKRAVGRAVGLTGETGSRVPRRVARVRLPRRSDFRAVTEANPLVLGAVGLGIGMILALLVPRRNSALRTFGLVQTSQRAHHR